MSVLLVSIVICVFISIFNTNGVDMIELFYQYLHVAVPCLPVWYRVRESQGSNCSVQPIALIYGT